MIKFTSPFFLFGIVVIICVLVSLSFAEKCTTVRVELDPPIRIEPEEPKYDVLELLIAKYVTTCHNFWGELKN